MKSKIYGALVAFLVVSTMAWAAVRTSYLNLPFTNDSSMNTALRVIDNQIASNEAYRSISSQIFCGEQANTTTIYAGPADITTSKGTYTDASMAGTLCDTLENTTEATADEAIYTALAVDIYGMFCLVDSSGSNGVTLTLRSGAADLDPTFTCTIATGVTECYDGLDLGVAPPRVAAAATMAVKSVTTEDLSGNDYLCEVYYRIVG